MQTLTVTRERQGYLNCVTIIKDCNGFVKAVITGYQQPKKSQKIIEINKKLYQLNFVTLK